MGIELGPMPPSPRRRGVGDLLAIVDGAPLPEILQQAIDQQFSGESATTAGGIDHFADYLPPGGVREAQLRLAAWGRPKMVPASGEPYGYSGPMVPGDFADMNNASDLDGTDDARTGLAIASFKRWANTNLGTFLATDTSYNQATHNALVSVTGAAIPDVAQPLPPNVIPFPGTMVPGALPTTLPGSLPLPVPGNMIPGIPGNMIPKSPSSGTGVKSDGPKWWAWALIAAGVALGLTIVFVVSKKRRRRKGS